MKEVLPTLTSDFKNTRVVCPSGVVSFLYGVLLLLLLGSGARESATVR